MFNLTANCPIRHRKPRGQGASRRGEIIAAATRIFVEEGVAAATMRRIAAAVGVSPTALYVYFPDKEAILAAIASGWFAELLAALEASQNSSHDTVTQFRAGLRTYIEFGAARPDSYRLTFLAAPPPQSGGEPCSNIPEADSSFDILVSGVMAMMQEGRFRQDDPAKVAETIWAALHGLTILLIDQTSHLTTPKDVLIEAMLGMIISGFSTVNP